MPIAFVSEHSETLVELDIEYKELAKDFKVPEYHRVPTLSTNKMFIASLAKLCKEDKNTRICPKGLNCCRY